MYGRRKYVSPKAIKPVASTDTTSPTFVCPRCNQFKSTAVPFTELTLLDKGQLVRYNKICSDCSKALQDWLKGK